MKKLSPNNENDLEALLRMQQARRRLVEHRQRVGDDSMSVILARALLLFVLTFDLFLNAYVLMSLDRDNLLIGTLTIVVSAIGQFGAITGQFGYSIGDLLTRTFVISSTMLVLLSILLGQFSSNFMTEISFGLTLAGWSVGLFICYARWKQQREQQMLHLMDDTVPKRFWTDILI